MKVNVSNPKVGRTVQKEVTADQVGLLVGRKIGQEIDLGPLGFSGAKGVIRGGSDAQGVPMRPEIQGPVRKKLVISKSIGLRNAEFGQKKKKTVRGNTVSDQTAQINIMVTPETAESCIAAFPEKPKEVKTEEAKT